MAVAVDDRVEIAQIGSLVAKTAFWSPNGAKSIGCRGSNDWMSGSPVRGNANLRWSATPQRNFQGADVAVVAKQPFDVERAIPGSRFQGREESFDRGSRVCVQAQRWSLDPVVGEHLLDCGRVERAGSVREAAYAWAAMSEPRNDQLTPAQHQALADELAESRHLPEASGRGAGDQDRA